MCSICGQSGHNARTHARHAAAAAAATATASAGQHTNQSPAAPSSTPEQQRACTVCGQQGHNAATHDQHAHSLPAQPAPRRPRMCSNCGQPGHDVRTCNQPQQEQQQRGAALTPAVLQELFAERPASVCDSCHRTFLASSSSGVSPREVRLVPGLYALHVCVQTLHRYPIGPQC